MIKVDTSHYEDRDRRRKKEGPSQDAVAALTLFQKLPRHSQGHWPVSRPSSPAGRASRLLANLETTEMDFHLFPFSVFLLVSICLEVSTNDPRIINLPKAECPGGWFFYNSHCYGFSKDRLSWYDAELDCKSYGSGTHLASITHSMEGIMISTLIKSYLWKENVWVGLHDLCKNNTWKWTDGADLQFKAWNKGEPNNFEDENCVFLLASRGYKFWSNANCTRPMQYMCEFRI
ncbi:regenerating islet-derived protein 4-like isoform X1 [Lissotriton helveticus]